MDGTRGSARTHIAGKAPGMWQVGNILVESGGRGMGSGIEEGNKVEGDGVGKTSVCHAHNTKLPGEGIEPKGILRNKGTSILLAPSIFRGCMVTYIATHADGEGVRWAEKKIERGMIIQRPFQPKPYNMAPTATSTMTQQDSTGQRRANTQEELTRIDKWAPMSDEW